MVAQLVEIQDSRLPEFVEVQEEVEKDWVAAQSKILAREQAQELLETAVQEGDLTEAAKRDKLQIQETGLFTANTPAQSLGNQRDVILAAFALTPEQPVTPDVYEVNQTFMIFRLKERSPASEEELQKEKESISRNLLQIKKEQVFNRWVTARRQQSEIRILQEL